MASELYNTIDALSREKGIDPQIVVSAVEDAIVMATRKYYKSQENLRAKLDKDTGKINAFAVKTVVETPEQVEDPNLQITLEDARKVDPAAWKSAGSCRFRKPTEGILGRIAAQLAKQVIFQKVREAERDTVYAEYNQRVGEMVNCTVKRMEGPDVIVDLARRKRACRARSNRAWRTYQIGDRIRAVITRSGSRGAGAAGGGFARRRPAGAEVVRDGSSGNLRQHGGDQGHRARGGRANQGGGILQGCGRGLRGRVRGHEGHARAVDHPRTARGENRHHRVQR